ncbi:MAG TPA: hypothetical protein VGI39_41790 [Polyangiaceae bacterium]
MDMLPRLLGPLALLTFTAAAACSSSGQTPVDTTGCGSPSGEAGAAEGGSASTGNVGSACVPSGGSAGSGGTGSGSGGGTSTGTSDAGGATSGGGADATVPVPPIPSDGG